MENHTQQGPSGHQLTLPIRGNPSNEQTTPGGQLANMATDFHNLTTKFEQLDVRVAATVPKLAEIDQNIEEVNQDYASTYSARIATDFEVSRVKERCTKLEEAEEACKADLKVTKCQLAAVYEHLGLGDKDQPSVLTNVVGNVDELTDKVNEMNQKMAEEIQILKKDLKSKEDKLMLANGRMFKMFDLMYKMSTAEISMDQLGNELKIMGNQLVAEAEADAARVDEFEESSEKMDEDVDPGIEEDGNKMGLWS